MFVWSLYDGFLYALLLLKSVFGWWRKCLNFTGMFFKKYLKFEKCLCKKSVLVFPDTHYRCDIYILHYFNSG